MPNPPPTFGKYEIKEPLGRGGFATVYRAHDASLERDIALKILAPHLTWEPDTVARFKQEARIAARLKHPNIVAIHEIGEVDGQIFIAMELIRGESLRDYLKRQGSLSIEETIGLLAPIADALDYAHSQGVVHRDVKPANILLEATHHGQTRPVLSDFGLVKSLAQSTEITQSGAVLGTVEYIAPEQADSERANEIGPATDLYALGIVAYHMLTGQVPFTGSSAQVLVSHLTRQPPSPRSLRADLPDGLSEVVLQALAKRPADRFASAAAFVQALRTGNAGTARPAPAPRRLPRWWPVALLILVAAVAVLGILAALPTSTPTGNPTPTPSPTPLPEAACTVMQDGLALWLAPRADDGSMGGVLRRGDVLRPLASVPDTPPNWWLKVVTPAGETGYVNTYQSTVDCNIDLWSLPPDFPASLPPDESAPTIPDLSPTPELNPIQGPTQSPGQAPQKISPHAALPTALTPPADTPPPAGSSSSGQPWFGPISFCLELDANNRCIEPLDTLPSGTPKFYVSWQYRDIPLGASFGRYWYRDGKELGKVSKDDVWDSDWNHPSGYESTWVDNGRAFPNGEYRVDLFIENELLQSGSVKIGN